MQIELRFNLKRLQLLTTKAARREPTALGAKLSVGLKNDYKRKHYVERPVPPTPDDFSFHQIRLR